MFKNRGDVLDIEWHPVGIGMRTLFALFMAIICACYGSERVAPRESASTAAAQTEQAATAKEAAPAPFTRRIDKWVTDEVGVLAPAEIADLEMRLKDIHERRLGQIVVLISTRVPNGQRLEDYTLTLMRHSGVGDKDRNDGVGILVFMDDRAGRIEVGSGLNARLTDSSASRIFQEVIRPAFQAGDYGQGMIRAVEAIEKVLVEIPAS